MVNDFVGLFIIFLPRVVLFRVATLHIALRDRRPKGKGKDEHTKCGRIAVPSPSCAHFHFPPSLLRPATQATLHTLLPQNMFLGVSSVVTMTTRCRKG